MSKGKSSSDKETSGGVGGAYPEGGGEYPRQGHLFYNTDPLWKVVELKEHKYWNEGFGIWESFPYYIKTQPLNWVEPEPTDKLPWED